MAHPRSSLLLWHRTFELSKDKPLTPAERAEAQAGKDKACNTLNRLKNAGGFTKIEPGYSGVTHAYVDRAFYSIPIDAKEGAMKAVALCYIDLDKKNQMGIVVVYDGYSGKQIGTYDFASGLKTGLRKIMVRFVDRS